jgi:hypothetical protein
MGSSRDSAAAVRVRESATRHRRKAVGRNRLAAIFLAGGALFVAIGVLHLMAVFQINRPDAAIFMRKTIAMTIPLLISGACLMLAGAYHLFHRRRE